MTGPLIVGLAVLGVLGVLAAAGIAFWFGLRLKSVSSESLDAWRRAVEEDQEGGR